MFRRFVYASGMLLAVFSSQKVLCDEPQEEPKKETHTEYVFSHCYSIVLPNVWKEVPKNQISASLWTKIISRPTVRQWKIGTADEPDAICTVLEIKDTKFKLGLSNLYNDVLFGLINDPEMKVIDKGERKLNGVNSKWTLMKETIVDEEKVNMIVSNLVVYEGRYYFVSFEAPPQLFEEYKKAFDTAIESFKILS